MLSIPTVVYGRNFMARSACQGEWTTVRFSWDDDPWPYAFGLSSGRNSAPEVHRLRKRRSAIPSPSLRKTMNMTPEHILPYRFPRGEAK